MTAPLLQRLIAAARAFVDPDEAGELKRQVDEVFASYGEVRRALDAKEQELEALRAESLKKPTEPLTKETITATFRRTADRIRQRQRHCDGKKAYADPKHALHDASAMMRHKGARGLQVYRCRECRKFHVGGTRG